ncbi:MAG TPA: hypothetical protein VMO47_08755 [Rhodothermales bacterium]|nr:hypothetical protein [Rhodothermales bacterium]
MTPLSFRERQRPRDPSFKQGSLASLEMTAAEAVSVILVFVSAASAQPATWPLVEAPGHFVFPLPPSLELAEGSFRSVVDNEQEYLIVADEDFSVIAQPASYRRDTEPFRMPGATILVRIEQGETGAYAELGADLSMPAEDLDQLDNDLRTGFIQEGEARGELSEVDWAGTEVVQIVGTQAIRFRYAADVGSSSDRMAVNTYLVQNNDSMYYITLSYLLEEQRKWVGDLETAVEAIRFERR